MANQLRNHPFLYWVYLPSIVIKCLFLFDVLELYFIVIIDILIKALDYRL